ncbi:amino acid transporter AVT6A-like [Quercus lobata]|uniref:Amino acid transporter transmembrane domain-containing protein n=1 Tax=Quercus lobata TaxID=97700 RepID=A0A7N2R9T5_QUELO|nr:amino acid transporter AVT6A-like [Quercus lobata]
MIPTSCHYHRQKGDFVFISVFRSTKGQRASITASVFNISTSIIGAGILALPAIMKVLGLGLGIGMIVFVAILTEGLLEILLRFGRVGNSHSYGEVMRDAFGRARRLLLQICILVNNVGTLIAYMIIIGNILFLIL